MPIVPRRTRLLVAFIGLLVIAIVVLCVIPRSKATGNSPETMVPTVTATKTAALVAGNGDGDADPGDTIEYTITINNTAVPGAGNDALGVSIADTVQGITSLVPGSDNILPKAKNDTYDTIGNTQLEVAAAQTISPGVFVNGNVKTNDVDFDGTFNITAFDSATTQGGTVSMNMATGTFLYTPQVGDAGIADTFTYTITDNQGATAIGTVTVNINAQKVWYVKNNQAAGGLGGSVDPFDTLVEAQTASAVGDTIYVFTGTGTTTNQNAGFTAKNNQRVIGEGVALTVPVAVNGGPNPTTLRAVGAAPLIGNSAGNGVTLGGGNTLSGFTIGDTTGFDIANTPTATVGTLTVTNVTLNGAGGLFRADSGGTLNVQLNSATTTVAGTTAILLGNTDNSTFTVNGVTTINDATTDGIGITNCQGSTFTFTGLVTILNDAAAANGDGVDLATNNTPNSTFNFNGGVNITVNGNNAFGFRAQNSGTVNLVDVGTTQVVSNLGTALVASSTALNAALDTITSSGGTDGINLNAMTGSLTAGTVGINGQSGDGINVTGSSGAVTISGGTIGNTNDPAGNGVEVNGSNGNISIAATLTKTTAGKVVLVTGRTGGTVSFSGNISGTGAVDNGIDVNANTATTVNFTGPTQTLTTGASTGVNLVTNGTGTINFIPAAGGNGLDINTTGGVGFNATGGGTFTVQGAGNTINATTGPANTNTNTALNVANTTIAAGGLTFQSIAAGNTTAATDPTNGIVLNTTGNLGGLTVTGDAGSTVNASGGIITNTTGAGISMTSTNNVSLDQMTVQNVLGDGILGTTVTNFGLTNSTVTNNGDALQEHGLEFANLFGTGTVTNTTFSNNETSQVTIINTSGTANVTFSNVSLSSTGLASVPNGLHGIHFETQTSASADLIIQNCAFNNLFSNSIHATNEGTGVFEVTIANSTFNNVGASAINIAQNNSGATRFFIHDNPTFLRGTNTGASHSININQAGGAPAGAVMEGQINNNTIGNNTSSTSASTGGNGIQVFSPGSGTTNVKINNNNIQGAGGNGINVQMSEDTNVNHKINATILNNVATVTDVNSFDGIRVVAGAMSGDAGTLCAEINNNDGSASAGNDFTVRQRFATTFQLRAYAGASTDTAAVQTHLDVNQLNDPLGAGPDWFITTQAPGGGFTNTPASGQCAQPTLPSFAEPAEMSAVTWTTGDPDFVNSLLVINSLDSFAFVDDRAPQSISDTYESVSVSGREAAPVEENEVAPLVERTSSQDEGGARVGELVLRLTDMISPTVYAQETKQDVAPESGETVNKGPFTLAAGESVVLKIRVIVDNGPFASGVNSITNTATINGSNFATLTPSSAAIALDAAPDLQVTVSDSNTTTQPGAVVAYTTTYQNNTATNGQNAGAVRVTQTVPINTTFNAAVSGAGWSCPDGSPATTVCTFDVGAVNAGTPPASLNFAVNALALLPAGAVNLGDTATIAENPLNANGNDRVPGNNSSSDTTNIIGNWDGSNSADWHLPANWSNDTIPPAGNSISIPLAGNQPQVTSADVTVNLLSLGRNLTINNGRTISASGNVVLGANVVDGLGTLSLGTASAITRTTGQVNATLRKNFAGPGPLFQMPVGTTGAFSPLSVTVTNGAGQLTARANTGVQPMLVANTARTLQRYWTLSGNGITSNITFNYLNGDVPGAPNNENIWTIIRVTGTTAIRYTPGPDVIMNAAANTFTINNLTTYSDWTAGEPLAPTAASAAVSGRVLDPEGRGVAGALVSMQAQNGNVIWATTNPFGNFRFVGLQSGHTYLVSATHKRYVFESRTVNVGDDVVGLDFTAKP